MFSYIPTLYHPTFVINTCELVRLSLLGCVFFYLTPLPDHSSEDGKEWLTCGRPNTSLVIKLFGYS